MITVDKARPSNISIPDLGASSNPPPASAQAADKLKSAIASLNFSRDSRDVPGQQRTSQKVENTLEEIRGEFGQQPLSREELPVLLQALNHGLRSIADPALQQKFLVCIRDLVGKNLSQVRFQSLSEFAHVITAQQDNGAPMHSTEMQKQIIGIAQSAFDHGWKNSHMIQKELSNEECEKFTPIVTKSKSLLDAIGKTSDLELQAAILKIAVGAFHATTAHILFPNSEAGQKLGAEINAFDDHLGQVIKNNQGNWKAAAKNSSNKSGEVSASIVALATLAPTSLAGSVTATLGAAGGGLLGVAEAAFGTVAIPFVAAANIIGTNRTRDFVREIYSAPVRHAVTGAKKGWNLVDPKSIASETFDALYSAPQPQNAKNRQSASTLQRLSLLHKSSNA